MKVFYAFKPELLEDYKQTKDELLKARSKMSDQSISEAKQEIIKECQIYDFNPKDTSNLYTNTDGIANIPIAGMLCQKVDICSAFFGETVTTYQFIQEAVKKADADPSISKIIFHANSGGGYADGCELTSQVISECKKKKYAAVYDMAASACYWLISQCDEIISVSKTAFTGSIGVAAEIIHRDAQDKMEGIERQTVTNTESKDKRPDYKTDEGLSVFVNELDAMYRVFTSTILKKREGPLSQKKIDALSGKVLITDEAISYGLIDTFMPLSELYSYVKSGNDYNEGFIAGISNQATLNIIENKPTPSIGENTEETMELKDFLAQNPDANAKYQAELEAREKKGFEAGKAEIETRVKKIVPFIGNKDYPGADTLAKKVLSGESSIDAFEGSIAAYDMMKVRKESNAAKEETEAAGETAPDHKVGADNSKNIQAEEDMKKAARYA